MKENSGQALGVGIALGVAVGAGVGAAIGNVGVGIALGVAIGAGLGGGSGRPPQPLSSGGGCTYSPPCHTPPHLLARGVVSTAVPPEVREALAEIPIEAHVREAILTPAGELGSVVQCAAAYERGDWLNVDASLEGAGLPLDAAARAYRGAVAWAAAVLGDRAATTDAVAA